MGAVAMPRASSVLMLLIGVPSIAISQPQPQTCAISHSCLLPTKQCYCQTIPGKGGTRCFDQTSDPNHCGKCYNKCASGVCVGGKCCTTCSAEGKNCGSIPSGCG